MDRTGTFQYLDETGQARLQQILPPGAIRVRKDKPSSQDMIVPLVRSLIERGEQVIVFRNRRGPAQGCAAYLARVLTRH